MQKLAPDLPMLPPGICFICEMSPDRAAHPVIDTGRTFEAGGPTHLSGRKYICHPCAVTALRVILDEDAEEIF